MKMNNNTVNNKAKAVAKEAVRTAPVRTGSTLNVRYIAVTGMLSAIAFILMFLDFSVPFMPPFIKLDISELPALIGSFAMGPVCGVLICLIKNLIHLTMSSTGGVGELSNFVLGVMFVLPAGLIYRHKKTKKSAVIGSCVGALLMALFSVVSNYYVVYPFYYNFMPEETIIEAYNAILQTVAPSAQLTSILPCLVGFNMPFTFFKGAISVVITLLTYKHISPLLKGRDR